jgi:hypothetical protein
MVMRGPTLHFPWARPEFGNREHIDAIQSYQRQIIQAEEEAAESADMREFEVEVEWSGSTTVRVRARSAAEAKEAAHEHVDFSGDLDDVNYTAREVEEVAPVVGQAKAFELGEASHG